jgi:transposase
LKDMVARKAAVPRRGPAVPAGPLELSTQMLGPLPVVDWFCARLGLAELLEAFVPHDDARLRLAPAVAIGVVVRNLVVAREPVYALGRWAEPFDPAPLGLAEGEAGLLNDDRVGRMLARLFDADRASLLTRLVLDAVARFGIDCSQLHNDSTSVTVTGRYTDADGRARGGKATAAITFGHNKDHRPDLKQLVWILTVTADGAVPIAHRVVDGNTSDDVTHVDTWDHLVALLGRADFLYVADCKLATRDNMDHIHRNRGRFVSVLPASRKEDTAFRDWIVDHEPDWVEAARRPGPRLGDPDEVWRTAEAPWPSTEGHRVVWVRSTAKTAYDAAARADRIARGTAALDELNQRLASPKTRMNTTVAVEQAAAATLDKIGAARWIDVTVEEQVQQRFRQEKRGRAGPDTRYRKISRTRHRIHYTIDQDQVARDAASDGCYPLISNNHEMTGAELLAAYKYQPNLEKRHAQLKGTQLAAPMFLHDPARIEALLCCHFIAMLIQALIERQIRQAMKTKGIKQLSLYPEDRGCTAPTTARVLNIFDGLARHHLTDQHGRLVQSFPPQLTELQALTLDLLDIPHSIYTG